MQKIKYLIIILILMFTIKVQAKEMPASSIPNGSYIIGTHEFNRNKATNYNGTLTVQHIMLAAKTIDSNNIEDMKIYYKNSRGAWIDPITNASLAASAVPSIFNIDYINLEPAGETTPQEPENTEYLINYSLNGGAKGPNSPSKAEVDQVITIDKPTKNFTVYIDSNSQNANVTVEDTPVTSVRNQQEFAGWTASNLNTEALYGITENPTDTWDGVAKIGADRDSLHFKNLAEVDEAVTLVANWNSVAVTLPEIEKVDHICRYNTKADGLGINYTSGAEYTPSSNGASATLYVVCEQVISFEDNTWETIISNVQAGNTAGYHVGDTKEIYLGDLGIYTLRIANKSIPADCETNGFSQTACGFVVEFADIIDSEAMNPQGQGGNVGGWPASGMREYLNDTIYNALPTALKNGIINTTVVSGHGSMIGEENFSSVDKLYLLSTHEIAVDVDEDNLDGIDYYDSAYYRTRQLDYYYDQEVTTINTTGAIKKYNEENNGWWLRSSFLDNTESFHHVDNTGNIANNYADYEVGVSPAFRIGIPEEESQEETFELGDYFSLTPTTTSYTIPDTLTGISHITLNPSELNLWRVIAVNGDGTVEAVSEYVSSTEVTLSGEDGYKNMVHNLQTISEQYSNPLVLSTRIVGYNGQTPEISKITPSSSSTPNDTTGIGQEYDYGKRGDTLYLKDYQLLDNIGSIVANKAGTTASTSYWLASRNYYYTTELPEYPEGFEPMPSQSPYFYFNGRNINAIGNLSIGTIYSRDGGGSNAPVVIGSNSHGIRPVITLKPEVTITGGSGTESEPYALELETLGN